MTLPVPAEINARLVVHGEHRNPLHLIAIRYAAVIFAP